MKTVADPERNFFRFLPATSQKFIFYVTLGLAITFLPGNSRGQVPLHPGHGIALIWYGDQDHLSTRDSLVTTGQIMFMWRNFEPEEGVYDFGDLDRQLKTIHEKGLKTTIQINGNVHPDFIFASVPYLKGIALPTQRDHRNGFGPPMYWNEVYKQKYASMIHALANHLLNSAYKNDILGIRQSYCAVGTEHHFIPEEYRTPESWTIPKNGSAGGPWPWTEKIADDYKHWTIGLFIREFDPPGGIPVFMRASAISNGVADAEQINMVKQGKLWLFHTSSEPQPRYPGKNEQYKIFVDYCKTGKTYGFMESWSKANTSSDGWRWTKTKQPITRAQFNYWTLLCDLNCGATFVAMRPEDVDDPAFRDDYEFASRYAGFLDAPQQSPGAWIAFREGDYLKGDYTFLMQRDPLDNSIPLYNVDDSKYGLWARKIGAGESMRLKLDQDFLNSMAGNVRIGIKILYKDDNHGSIRIHAIDKYATIEKKAAGEWKTANFFFRLNTLNPLIDVIAREDDLTIHKIEVIRLPNGLN